MTKLYQHQIDALNWLQDKPKVLLGLDAGLGKSAIAIKTFKPNENILIIAPATLKQNWFREIKLWSEYSPTIHIIKKKTDKLQPGVNIVNYDILGSKKNKKIVSNFDFKNFKVDRLIVDESHYIKNPKSIRSKITAKLIHQIKNVILLSGTPSERTMDLYVPLRSLGVIDTNMHSFGVKYCGGKKIYLGRKEVWDYRGNTRTDELKELMSGHCLFMTKEDVIDLPEKVFSVIGLDLPVSRREKEYNLEDILEDTRPIGFEGLSELLHEQALLKLPLCIKHIKMRLESTHKIVIFAKHHDVIDSLMHELKSFNPVKLDGRCSATQKDDAVSIFQNDKNCRLFIGQIKASGVGLTLTSSSDVIFVETNWSYSDLSQCADRVHRIGAKNNVYIEILTIANSIDERVLYTTLIKKEFKEDIFK